MLKKVKIIVTILHLIKNWPIYFLTYFKLLNKKHVRYTLRNGTKYKIRPQTPDFGTILEVWAQHIYTPKNFSLNDTDIVVDIGAHIGVFSVFAAKHVHRGKIYSFEPIPENFQLLKENITINKIKNIIPFNTAISSKKQEQELFVSEKSPGVGSLHYKKGKGQHLVVSSITLKDFVSKTGISHIDFLKIDCEGSEYDILFSCPTTILQRIKKISMEYHELDNLPPVTTLINFLEQQGFKVTTNPTTHALYALNK